MGQVVFIGDEVTAAGFRLAGVDCHTPEPDDLPKLVTSLRNDSDLILITAGFAEWLGTAKIAEMALWTHPMVAVLPDIRNQHAPPNLEHAVRRELGIEV